MGHCPGHKRPEILASVIHLATVLFIRYDGVHDIHSLDDLGFMDFLRTHRRGVRAERAADDAGA